MINTAEDLKLRMKLSEFQRVRQEQIRIVRERRASLKVLRRVRKNLKFFQILKRQEIKKRIARENMLLTEARLELFKTLQHIAGIKKRLVEEQAEMTADSYKKMIRAFVLLLADANAIKTSDEKKEAVLAAAASIS